MTKRVYNFSAGPATLPLPVLEKAQQTFLALPEAGMSVLEMSHRSEWFTHIIETAEANIRKLYSIPGNYSVLFLQGGATLQFSMLAASFLRGSSTPADYVLTGSWANKAIKEANKEGPTHIAWDGKGDNFIRVPRQDELELNADSPYVHITSNETIQGVEWQKEPDTQGVPLLCDMSSDFLSRPIDVSKYAMIYAGAQKNAGGAGVTVVIVRNDMLEKVPENLPSMMDYRLLAEKKSLYNTPPSYAIYIVMLVTEWLLNQIGGLEAMNRINQQKAGLLYELIDQSDGFYNGHAQTDSRSLMNVTWRLPNDDLQATFLKQAKACNLYELKGHRSVGGIRASIYNAMTMEGVQALRDFMMDFQKQHG